MSSNQRIAVIGGGQLGRMLGEANRLGRFGHQMYFLDPSAPHNSAAEFASWQLRGSLGNAQDITQFAAQSHADVLTVEVEHTSPEALKTLEESGQTVRPSSATLAALNDKFKQVQLLEGRGFPVPRSTEIQAEADLHALPAGEYMLKQKRGSYDGRGNFHFRGPPDTQKAMAHFAGEAFFAQEMVDFAAEVSVVGARSVKGEVVTFDVAENQHQHSILLRSIVPARITAAQQQRAKELATGVIKLFADVGVMAVEMFLTKTGELLINEIAPRVHNSGHWTMNNVAKESQFSQHLRAITGESLGSTQRHAPVIMHNILGAEGQSGYLEPALPPTLPAPIAAVHVHLYKKAFRPARKVGHINIVGEQDADIDVLVGAADALVSGLRFRPIADPFLAKQS